MFEEIMQAIKYGNYDRAIELIELADLGVFAKVDANGESIIYSAIEQRAERVSEHLIKKLPSALLNVTLNISVEGTEEAAKLTLLHAAVCSGSEKTCMLLLPKLTKETIDAEMEVRVAEGSVSKATALYIATDMGLKQVYELLLSKTSAVEVHDTAIIINPIEGEARTKTLEELQNNNSNIALNYLLEFLKKFGVDFSGDTDQMYDVDDVG